MAAHPQWAHVLPWMRRGQDRFAHLVYIEIGHPRVAAPAPVRRQVIQRQPPDVQLPAPRCIDYTLLWQGRRANYSSPGIIKVGMRRGKRQSPGAMEAQTQRRRRCGTGNRPGQVTGERVRSAGMCMLPQTGEQRLDVAKAQLRPLGRQPCQRPA